MSMIRRTILALALFAWVVPAFAQAPPPVPALPDTERRTSYSIRASTCACAVGFQLYGDSTDYANWIEVFVNGVMVTQAGNWTITSPTGSFATIPRPITDAVLTFTVAQTGTVQIVGARRPRRTSQFSESRGVAARDINQVISDLVAQNRETWDKINDVTGRSVRAPPGETLALLPQLASRANMGAYFDAGGNLVPGIAASGTFIAGTAVTFTGTNPTTISVVDTTNANNITSGTLAPARGGTGANNSTNSAGDILSSSSTNGNFAARSLNALCTLAPGACNLALGYTSILWYGAVCDGTTDDTVAIQNAINSFGYAGGGLLIPATAFGGTNSGRTATGGCVIRLQGSPQRANCALVITKPIHLFGQGHGSLLKTEASMATTTDNVCIVAGDANWDAAKFENFSIGLEGEYHPATVTQPYRRYGKRGLAFLVDANPSGFQDLIVDNVMIGESFNGYAIYFEGLATQGSRVMHSDIFGGLAFSQVADSNQILFNRIGGITTGTYGLYIDAPGAGKTNIQGNAITAPGSITLVSGSGTTLADNYIEQGANTTAGNIMVDIQSGPWTMVRNNLIQSFSAPVSVGIKICAGCASTIIDGNVFSASGVQGVNNFSPTTICQGLNVWNTAATHVVNGGAGALKNAIGTGVADCP